MTTDEAIGTTPMVDAIALFADRQHLECDWEDCDGSLHWPLLWRIEVRASRCITDSFIAIPEQLLEHMPVDGVTDYDVSLRPEYFPKVPSSKPDLYVHQSARNLERLDGAGLTTHAGTDEVCHLYLGDEQVGWSTNAKPGSELDPADLPLVRELGNQFSLEATKAHKAIKLVRDFSGRAPR